jgi:hypothetical protein
MTLGPDEETPKEMPAPFGVGWVPERGPRRTAGQVLGVVRKLSTLQAPRRGEIPRDPWILNQGSKNACTGHNGAQLVYGLTGNRVSPWMLWLYGRLRDGATLGTLSNDGVRTSAMLSAFRKHGACFYDGWRPGLNGFEYDAPPPALLRLQAQKFNLGVTPLYERGQRLVDLIVDALARHRPCGLVVRVDKGFDRAKSDPVGPEDGATRGQHIITPWSFYEGSNGYVIECVNSWGDGHGDGGIVRLTAERVGQAPFACVANSVA